MIDAIILSVLFVIPLTALYYYNRSAKAFMPCLMIILFTTSLSVFMLIERSVILVGVYVSDTGAVQQIYIQNPFSIGYLVAVLYNVIMVLALFIMRMMYSGEIIGEA